jgi:hypothetical protein
MAGKSHGLASLLVTFWLLGMGAIFLGALFGSIWLCVAIFGMPVGSYVWGGGICFLLFWACVHGMTGD